MQKATRRSSAGFTLIEVLVVVAIIALLVAILLPSLSRARRQARIAVCASNLHQVTSALMMYRMTFSEFPHQARVGVPGCDPRTPGGNVTGAWTSAVHKTIGRFIGKKSDIRPNEIFYCPSVRESDRGAVDVDREEPACSPGLSNPEPYLHITYFYYGRLNMGANDPALPRAGETSQSVPARRKLYVTKEPDARRILFADAVSLWAGKSQWRVNHGPDYTRYSLGSKPRLEGQNVAYGDGHAQWRPGYAFPRPLLDGISGKLKDSAMLLQGEDLHWW